MNPDKVIAPGHTDHATVLALWVEQGTPIRVEFQTFKYQALKNVSGEEDILTFYRLEKDELEPRDRSGRWTKYYGPTRIYRDR